MYLIFKRRVQNSSQIHLYNKPVYGSQNISRENLYIIIVKLDEVRAVECHINPLRLSAIRKKKVKSILSSCQKQPSSNEENTPYFDLLRYKIPDRIAIRHSRTDPVQEEPIASIQTHPFIKKNPKAMTTNSDICRIIN